MASVDIGKVDKFFGSTQVLYEVEIEISDGEFVVLVGPSGCGKSTLLRMIAGLEEISRGEIAIGGRVVNNVPPKDRDNAMVFQNYALYPHMTVFDNMAFSLKLAKAPKDEMQRRVQKAAQILGLQEYLERYPRQLSGGQRQRVAMGRAIVRAMFSAVGFNTMKYWVSRFRFIWSNRANTCALIRSLSALRSNREPVLGSGSPIRLTITT
jgi:multiple sugar transport system ATP-binding protein